MGRIQRECLRLVQEWEEGTTYDIGAKVYRVKPSKDGFCYLSDAQHVAVKRALEGLQRKGLIIGFRTQQRRSPDDGGTELCHTWMTKTGLAKWLAKQREAVGLVNVFNPEYALRLVERLEHIEQKARTMAR
jgi:hypothetical protein